MINYSAVIMLADEDRNVIAGPFSTHEEFAVYCDAKRKSDKRKWTAYVLNTPPEMYTVIDGKITRSSEAL